MLLPLITTTHVMYLCHLTLAHHVVRKNVLKQKCPKIWNWKGTILILVCPTHLGFGNGTKKIFHISLVRTRMSLTCPKTWYLGWMPHIFAGHR